MVKQKGVARPKTKGGHSEAPSSPLGRYAGPSIAVLVAASTFAAVGIFLGQGETSSSGGNEKTVVGSSWVSNEAGSWEEAARAAGISMNLKETEMPGTEVEARVVSQSPRIYMFEDLLSPAECEFLKKLVQGRLKPAGVVRQTEDKHTVETETRNNHQIWLTPQEENEIPVLRHIMKRLHRVAHIPDTDAEALQIGRYEVAQKYEAHVDSAPSHDVARPATMLIYLNDVESGGDTLFPLKQRENCSATWHRAPGTGEKSFGCSKCCDGDRPDTIRVRPKQGRALLFFSHDLSNGVDMLSEHAACPVKSGVKWIAQRWFRFQPYQNIQYGPDPRFDGLPSLQPSSNAGGGDWDGQVRVLNSKGPRAFLLDNFLSAEESAHLLHLASTLDRSNASAELELWQVPEEVERDDPVVARVVKRMHRAAFVPEANAELLQLTRYGEGASAPLRHDAKEKQKRTATILIYLSDAEGGEVVIPIGGCKTLEDCCRDGGKTLIVPARVGRAVLIYARDVAQQVDQKAVYGACPVRGGTKWMAQRWFQSIPLRSFAHAADPLYDLPPFVENLR